MDETTKIAFVAKDSWKRHLVSNKGTSLDLEIKSIFTYPNIACHYKMLVETRFYEAEQPKTEDDTKEISL